MPIPADGTIDPTDLGPESGFEDFLKNLADAGSDQPSDDEVIEPVKTPKEQPEDEPTDEPEEDDESPSDEGEEKDGSEEEDEGKEPEKKFADDGAYLKIKVGDQEHEVSIKDLGRLYGQEAALTQKSQQVAEQRKAVEEEVKRNLSVSEALLQRARQRFEPYSKVDFNLAAQQLSPEEYTALRNEAMSAYQDVQFLEQHTGEYVKHVQAQQSAALRERASATLKELGDAEKGIPGWNQQMYSDMVSFATSKYGVPAEVMNTMVDSWGFRILHDAMAFHKAKDVNASVKVTKVNKTPKKVVKTTTPPAAARVQGSKGKAMTRLQQTGSVDDAELAFLESLADRD